MPIKGLTNREAAFPQIGILRKGAPKPNEKQPGQDLQHFRFTTEHAEVMAQFQAVYGDEPRDINVFLPYRTTGENFSAWREHWVAGGLIHRCDGETCTVWRTKEGTYSTEPRKCPGQCKPVGRLSVIVPELKRLAFVTVLTTSLHDIMTITENLEAVEMLRGDLRGIPLILRRRPRKVSTPRGDKRVRSEKWLLTLEAAPSWVSLQLATQQAMARPLLPDGSLPELEAPDDENDVVVDALTGEILDTGPASAPEPETEPEKPQPAPKKPQAQAKPAPQPQPTANGAQVASIKSTDWKEGAVMLAATLPNFYANDKGDPNFYKMTRSAATMGYATITDANLAEVLEVLVAYAADNGDQDAQRILAAKGNAPEADPSELDEYFDDSPQAQMEF